MVVTRGSGSNDDGRLSAGYDDIRMMIIAEVVVAIREAIPKMFGSIKRTLIETFVEHYAAVTETAVVAATASLVVARPRRGDLLWYREFTNMNPSKFDGTQDPIAAMRWISDVEGCFYTCSYPKNLRVRFSLNLLCLGAKDWWKFLTADYTPLEHVAMTWERFTAMLRDKFFPTVEHERLVQEFLSLK